MNITLWMFYFYTRVKYLKNTLQFLMFESCNRWLKLIIATVKNTYYNANDFYFAIQ